MVIITVDILEAERYLRSQCELFLREHWATALPMASPVAPSLVPQEAELFF